ncbi:hypothetical protein [Flammeovirga pacifica]|uniref:Outer membrane protein beta-barrel domain-containing protein n=1 Tax=Flammeovirga pacifica TaxID=915059 RepID=A0A1S1YSE3_FLAPC|nr:hypothetical protein [Flammeovirga pacifica]OHX63926.1 hypothetical protein NH26_20155 [Flammeovirga pacifica]
MKKLLFSVIFLISFYTTISAQTTKRFNYAKQPTGMTLGAYVGDESQFKVGVFSHYVYFSFSSNFASTDGNYTNADLTGGASIQDKGKYGITQYNLGPAIPLFNKEFYGIYIVPQGTYSRKFNILDDGTNKYKGDVVGEWGGAVDLMYVDHSGFTIQLGGSSVSGINIGAGYSF